MSIGILSGKTPWELEDDARWPGPIITAAHVSDARAEFVADPFGINVDSNWYVFFEFMNREKGKGEIGWAFSNDLQDWTYGGTALAENFHLSYPAVYEASGEFWMVPETWESGEVRLYRADPFPNRWVLDRVLIPDLAVTDPTIFSDADGGWRMIACEAGREHNRTLVSFSAQSFLGSWNRDSKKSLVENRPDQARPGGHVFTWQGMQHRLGQDCSNRYGEALRSYPLTSPWTESSGDVVVAVSDTWRSMGGHHADLHWQEQQAGFIAFVDGEMGNANLR